jgi:hypothetical protein
MLPIYEAAWEMHIYLSRRKIPYVLIGGLAVQKWGQPRLTKDVDLTISVPVENEALRLAFFLCCIFISFDSLAPSFCKKSLVQKEKKHYISFESDRSFL